MRPENCSKLCRKNALRVVARDDAGVVGHAAERGLDRALGDALRGRLLLDPFKPGAEIAAARRRRRGGRHHHGAKPKHHKRQVER